VMSNPPEEEDVWDEVVPAAEEEEVDAVEVDVEEEEATPGPLDMTAAAATTTTRRTTMPARTLLPMAERLLWKYKLVQGGVASDICVG